MKKLLALLIACLALTIVACGDDDDDDGGSNGGGTTTEQTDTGGNGKTPPGGTVAVDIPEIAFEPASLTVKKGTTVKWTNSDDLPHTVTKDSGPGPDFDSGNIEPDGTFEQTLNAKGKINYVCTIHPGQEGSVTVK